MVQGSQLKPKQSVPSIALPPCSTAALTGSDGSVLARWGMRRWSCARAGILHYPGGPAAIPAYRAAAAGD